MSKLNTAGTAVTTSGNSSTTITPATSGALKVVREETTRDITIPAGANEIEVLNTDPSGAITVNGKAVSYQGIFKVSAFFDPVNNSLDLAPEVVIVASSRTYIWFVAYPSNSSEDPTTI